MLPEDLAADIFRDLKSIQNLQRDQSILNSNFGTSMKFEFQSIDKNKKDEPMQFVDVNALPVTVDM